MPQELKINRLLWLDILVLYCIMKHTETSATPPLKRELFNRGDRSGLVNQFIQSNNVDYIYSKPLTSDLPVQDAINKLRRIGFLSQDGYKVLSKGFTFFEIIGADWRKWPLDAPISSNNTLDAARTIYAPY